MLYEIWIQLRKYAAVMLVALAVLLASDLCVEAWHRNAAVVAISGIARMLVWCFVVCFMAYELYHYACGGNDYLLLTLPGGRRVGLTVKTVAFAAVLVVYTLVEFPFFIAGQQRGGPGAGLHGAVLARVSLFDLVSRLLGIAAFFVVFGVIVQLAAALNGSLASLALTLIAYIGITIVQGCAIIVPLAHSHAGWQFTIGVTDSSFVGVSQFINILPVVAFKPASSLASMAESALRLPAVAVNVVLLVAFALVWHLVCPKVRVNWVR